jgi:hypothetical protein
VSIRAYRVNKIEIERSSSFNLWHDDELMDFLEKNDCFAGFQGSGIVDIPKEILLEALDILALNDDIRQSLKRDIELSQDDLFVTYYCF